MLRRLALLAVCSSIVSSERRLPLDYIKKDHFQISTPLPHTYIQNIPDAHDWREFNGTSYTTAMLNQHIPTYCGRSPDQTNHHLIPHVAQVLLSVGAHITNQIPANSDVMMVTTLTLSITLTPTLTLNLTPTVAPSSCWCHAAVSSLADRLRIKHRAIGSEVIPSRQVTTKVFQCNVMVVSGEDDYYCCCYYNY